MLLKFTSYDTLEREATMKNIQMNCPELEARYIDLNASSYDTPAIYEEDVNTCGSEVTALIT